MPFGLGFGETVLILFVVLLFFGPKRLPEAASSLGKGIREFKKSMSGIGEELSAPQNTVAAPYTGPQSLVNPLPPPEGAIAAHGEPSAHDAASADAAEAATASADAEHRASPAAPAEPGAA